MLILDQQEYDKVQPLCKAAPFNTYFAQAVLTKTLAGTVYVDNLISPETALIFHPYGMLLLCGSADNAVFNRGLADFMLNTSYPRALWLQVSSVAWSRKLEEMLGERLKRYPLGKTLVEAENEFHQLNRENVVECTRVNFKFNPGKYQKGSFAPIEKGLSIRRMDKELFQNISGTVVAKYFWNSYEEFAFKGVGFGVVKGQTLVSACFTAFVFANLFEVGIETNPDFRGRGYAGLAARAFIDHCLENNLEPVWGCRKENWGPSNWRSNWVSRSSEKYRITDWRVRLKQWIKMI